MRPDLSASHEMIRADADRVRLESEAVRKKAREEIHRAWALRVRMDATEARVEPGQG